MSRENSARRSCAVKTKHHFEPLGFEEKQSNPAAIKRVARSMGDVCFSLLAPHWHGWCVHRDPIDSKAPKRGKHAKIAGPFEESFACLPRLEAFEMQCDRAARTNRQPFS